MPWLWLPEVGSYKSSSHSRSNALSDSDYRDRLELKSTNNRTLGVGAYESEGTLLMLTASTMVRVVADLDKIGTFDYE